MVGYGSLPRTEIGTTVSLLNTVLTVRHYTKTLYNTENCPVLTVYLVILLLSRKLGDPLLLTMEGDLDLDLDLEE